MTGWVVREVEPPEPPYVPDDIGWCCYECGSTEGFTRNHNYHCGTLCDCDVECDECGSVDTGEEVLTYKESQLVSR